jgi:CP family cyanate transporter-like MFS transporter
VKDTQRRSFDPAWLVILAGVIAALHVGKLYPALPVLRESLGITLVQAGFLLSTVQLAGMTMGLAVGLTADGVGLKKCMLTGLLVLFGAGVPVEWAKSATEMLALRALEGFGFLLVITPAPSLIRRLVSSHKLGSVLGIWGTYMPLATALALLGGPALIALAGWQVLWWALSALSLGMALWLWRVVPALPPQTTATPLDWKGRLRQTLSVPGPWLVALCFAVYSSQWVSVIGFLPSIYAQAGISGAMTAWLTALAAAVNMVGNAASGRLLGAGVRPQRLLMTGYAVMAVSAFAAFMDVSGLAVPPALRYAAILVFSAAGGVIPGTLFTLAVRLAPTENTVSTTVGWMQQWSSFGQFAGPPLVALVASRAGGWQLTWVVTASLAACGLALAHQVGKLHMRSVIPS